MALKNEFLILVLICLMAYATAARNYELKTNTPGYNLPTGFVFYGGQFTECFNALLKLKSCSYVTLQYFLTGQADTSSASECCSAIEVSTSKCYPPEFSSLGFTAPEGNLLSTYCSSIAPAPAPS